MLRAAWIRSEQSAHIRALGTAQAFPLIGDGDHARAVYTDPKHLTMNGELAPALAEARYQDWVYESKYRKAAELVDETIAFWKARSVGAGTVYSALAGKRRWVSGATWAQVRHLMIATRMEENPAMTANTSYARAPAQRAAE